jgi:hypothetical protein
VVEVEKESVFSWKLLFIPSFCSKPEGRLEWMSRCNPLDCGGNICSVKGLSHANLRGPPRKGFSVYSFIYQNLYKRFSKGTRIMKGNPSIILAKRSDLSNEEALH